MVGQSSSAPFPASTVPPQLVSADKGENTLEFSRAQECPVETVTTVARAVTENNDGVTYWCPWEDDKETFPPPVQRVRATPMASFKHFVPNLGRGGEGLEPHLVGGTGGYQPQLIGGVGGIQLQRGGTLQPHQTTTVGPFYNLTSLAPPMPRLRDLLLTTVTPVRRSELPLIYPTTSYLPSLTTGPTASRFVPFQARQYVVRPAGSRISMKRRTTQIERPPMQ